VAFWSHQGSLRFPGSRRVGYGTVRTFIILAVYAVIRLGFNVLRTCQGRTFREILLLNMIFSSIRPNGRSYTYGAMACMCCEHDMREQVLELEDDAVLTASDWMHFTLMECFAYTI